MRNLQEEQVRKAFCYQKLFWPVTVWIHCSRDLKKFCKFLTFSLEFQKFFLDHWNNFSHIRSEQFWYQNNNLKIANKTYKPSNFFISDNFDDTIFLFNQISLKIQWRILVICQIRIMLHTLEKDKKSWVFFGFFKCAHSSCRKNIMLEKSNHSWKKSTLWEPFAIFLLSSTGQIGFAG